MKSEENKLVSYTVRNITIQGMLVTVGASKYILHNENGFTGGCTTISYPDWIKEFGKTYKYYISAPIMKNVIIGTETYELWN